MPALGDFFRNTKPFAIWPWIDEQLIEANTPFGDIDLDGSYLVLIPKSSLKSKLH